MSSAGDSTVHYLETINNDDNNEHDDVGVGTYVVLDHQLVQEAMLLAGQSGSSVTLEGGDDGEQMEIMVLKDNEQLNQEQVEQLQADLNHYVQNNNEEIVVHPTQCCMLCNDSFNAVGQDSFDIQSIYIVNGRRFSMLDKLQKLLGADFTKTNISSTQVCRNCFGVIEEIHMMETKIVSLKDDLSEKFQNTIQTYGSEIVPIDVVTNEDEMESNNVVVVKQGPVRKKAKRKTAHVEKEMDDGLSSFEEFNCPKCKKVFTRGNFDDYVAHVRKECGLTKSVICYDCGKVFRNRSSLEAHRRVEHKQKRVEVSDTEPETEPNNENDPKEGGENNSETVKDGEEKTKKTKRVKKHKQISVVPIKEEVITDENILDCEVPVELLGEGFDDKTSPFADAVYHCAGCDKQFTTKSQFTYHIRTKHKSDLEAQQNTSKCLKCQKPLQPNDLKKHVCRWYVCEVCKIQVSSKPQLRTHLLTHQNYRPFNCPQCVKTFTRKEYLTIHLRVHNDERPYSCDFCTKNFRSKTHLNNHRRLHTGEKPYICQHCGMAFPVPQNLHSHLQTHRGIKPMKCDICERCFRDQSHLKKHYRIHTGEKPYQCSICGRVFASRSNCQAHERTHTKDIKLWPCTYCGKNFPRKSKLRDHMLIHEQSDVIIYKTQEVLEAGYDPKTLQHINASQVGDLPLLAYQTKKGQGLETSVHEGYNNDEVIVVQVFSYPDQQDGETIVPTMQT